MEIWLEYGDTEIALDIKAENLLENLSYKFNDMDEEGLLKAIESIDNKPMNICILEDNKILVDLAIKISRLKNLNAKLYAPKKIKSIYREYDINSLDNSIYNKDDTLLLAKASFDPLFGYNGVPARIMRNYPNSMLNIVKNSKEPLAGVSSDALAIAYEHIKSFASRSIEVIMNNNTVIDLIIDEPIRASQRAINRLNTFRIKSERCKAIIIGSGRSFTLSSALNSLWNCINIIKEGSKIVLLAESRDGLGSDALEMFINGNLNKDTYIEGMEDIVFLNWAKARYDISLITSLPDYYLKILGLRSFRSISEALKYILESNPKQKVTVVQDASNILLEVK